MQSSSFPCSSPSPSPGPGSSSSILAGPANNPLPPDSSKSTRKNRRAQPPSAPSTDTHSNSAIDHNPRGRGERIKAKTQQTEITADQDKATEADASQKMDLLRIKEGSEKGNRANIWWRRVPLQDLRSHPLYHPLPRPEEVVLKSTSDLCLFRQDSWQWDALHQGRLTTSRLAAVLGIYEKASSAYLKIPQSLCGHERAVAAWQHLRQKPPLNWDHLGNNAAEEELELTTEGRKRKIWLSAAEKRSVWQRDVVAFGGVNDGDAGSRSAKFAYNYMPDRRLHYAAIEGSSSANRRMLSTSTDVRLAWGSAQEATAVLAALNFFAQHNADARLSECGMCLFEALYPDIAETQDNRQDLDELYSNIQRQIQSNVLPPLGASPDGIIHHNNDSSVEVLEVKCFSPFIQDSTGVKRLTVSTNRPSQEGIPVWHIPQLQMEILCAGKQCVGAVMIVLYIDGAKIYRIPRDSQVTRL